MVHEEVEHSIGVVQGVVGEHRNHLKGDLPLLQPADATHHRCVGGQAGAGAAMGVMQEGGAIHAHAHMDTVALEAVAPGRIDHRGVGLQRLVDRVGRQAMAFQHLLNARGRLVVKADRRRQRLTRMPEQGEAAVEIGALQHPLQCRLQDLQGEAAAVIATGQVAVVAIEVAEGGGLHHQQAQGPERRGRRE